MFLLLFWHAPLGVCSIIRRHQSPHGMVLGQCEVVGSQITLDGVQPCDTTMLQWSLPVIWWGGC